MAEAAFQQWWQRTDFGTGTGTNLGVAATFTFTAAQTNRITLPATSDPPMYIGPIGGAFGWAAFSHGGTDSDIAASISMIVNPQISSFFFSTIVNQAITSGVAASGAATGYATADLSGVSISGHAPYARLVIQCSKTAAGSATLTLGAGFGIAAL